MASKFYMFRTSVRLIRQRKSLVSKQQLDPWVSVNHPDGVYWWNKETDETTAVGAAKPGTAPPPAQQAAPAGGGLLNSIKEGFVYGTGFSLASRLVDSFMPRQMEVNHTYEDNPASEQSPEAPADTSGDSNDWGDSW